MGGGQGGGGCSDIKMIHWCCSESKAPTAVCPKCKRRRWHMSQIAYFSIAQKPAALIPEPRAGSCTYNAGATSQRPDLFPCGMEVACSGWLWWAGPAMAGSTANALWLC